MIFYDPKFVDADLRLRHGGHINRSDLVTFSVWTTRANG